MTKKSMGKRSIIGAVGGVLLGAAMLLFVATMVLNALKATARPGRTAIAVLDSATQNATAVANRAEWNTTNATVDQLKTFLAVCTVLLGILGIVLIGATIISAIGGGLGGGGSEE